MFSGVWTVSQLFYPACPQVSKHQGFDPKNKINTKCTVQFKLIKQLFMQELPNPGGGKKRIVGQQLGEIRTKIILSPEVYDFPVSNLTQDKENSSGIVLNLNFGFRLFLENST